MKNNCSILNLEHCREDDLSVKFGTYLDYDLIINGIDLILGCLKDYITGDKYFCKPIGYDEKYQCHLYFKVLDSDLILFFDKKITLLDLINKNKEVHIRSFNTKVICPVDKIHPNYLPSYDSFFNERDYTNDALRLKSELNTIIVYSKCIDDAFSNTTYYHNERYSTKIYDDRSITVEKIDDKYLVKVNVKYQYSQTWDRTKNDREPRKNYNMKKEFYIDNYTDGCLQGLVNVINGDKSTIEKYIEKTYNVKPNITEHQVQLLINYDGYHELIYSVAKTDKNLAFIINKNLFENTLHEYRKYYGELPNKEERDIMIANYKKENNK